jgi:hypothetical protein
VGAGVICRGSVGACDLAETCNNSATACPTDGRVGVGVICRSSTGACDLAETCNNSATLCPTDARVGVGVICRSSSGACDLAETCNNSATLCPADGRVGAGVICRGSVGACDLAETCNNSATLCPVDGRVGAGVICRGSVGACDLAETCNNSATVCPTDNRVGAGVICRSSTGACDLAETCNNSATVCPADGRVGVGVICRSSAGACDLAETCNNSATVCPTDSRVGAGVSCRGSAGVCDLVETCNGTATVCPTDSFASGTVCRGSTSIPACDPVETCNGAMAACPSDVVTRPPTTEVCNAVDDNCDGVVDNGPSTTCGSAIGLGTINMGGVVTRTTDWIAGPAGSEQWYSVTFPQNADYASHGTGTPTIQLTAGASVRFDVQSAACGPNMPCGSGGSSTGLTSWSFADNLTLGAGGYTTRNTAWPTTVYIRVYRISATTTCTAQTLTVSRPASLAYYSGNFTAGVAPSGTAACSTWDTFRASLSPAVNYQTVRLNGNLNPGGRQCNGAAANTLCQALRTGSFTGAVPCNGTNWYVNECYGGRWEISASGHGCDCNAPHVVRACHQDGNFGGVDGVNYGSGPTCGQPTQSMGVSCDPAPSYSGSFTGGVAPNGTQACTDWNAFRSTISAGVTYSVVTLSGSNNSAGRTCTGAAANTLCQALRSGTPTSIPCNGTTWVVDTCGAGNWEISASGGGCDCNAPYVVRPCHGDLNFGGLNGAWSCGQASQTLQVNCQ